MATREADIPPPVQFELPAKKTTSVARQFAPTAPTAQQRPVAPAMPAPAAQRSTAPIQRKATPVQKLTLAQQWGYAPIPGELTVQQKYGLEPLPEESLVHRAGMNR